MTADPQACPECGAPADAIVFLDSQASSWGYAHVDEEYQCMECHFSWLHGHPQGDGPSRDWTCPVCLEDELRPHKIDPRPDPIHADMKCPNCHYWTPQVTLLPLDNGEYAFAYDGTLGEIP